MKTLFSTAAVHVRDRFDYWHEQCRHTIADHEAVAENVRHFDAELQVGRIADVDLIVCGVDAMTTRVTSRHASNANNENLLLYRQVSGASRVWHGDWSVELGPGDIGFWDLRQSYSSQHINGSLAVIAKVPRSAMTSRIGASLGSPVIKIDRTAGLGASLADLVGALPRYEPGLDQTSAILVQNTLLDLAAVAVLGTLGRDATLRLSASRSLSLAKLRSVIAARLHDPNFNAAAAATAAGLSIRYANELLASRQTSIGRLIRQSRLEKCRAALDDPAQDHRTVSEIAFGWGFSDLTHFGRVFRAAYGATPRDYRHTRRER